VLSACLPACRGRNSFCGGGARQPSILLWRRFRMGDGRASGVVFWFPIAWLVSPRAPALPRTRGGVVRDGAEPESVPDGPGFDFLARLAPAGALRG
jgi:hypothetical protein